MIPGSSVYIRQCMLENPSYCTMLINFLQSTLELPTITCTFVIFPPGKSMIQMATPTESSRRFFLKIAKKAPRLKFAVISRRRWDNQFAQKNSNP